MVFFCSRGCFMYMCHVSCVMCHLSQVKFVSFSCLVPYNIPYNVIIIYDMFYVSLPSETMTTILRVSILADTLCICKHYNNNNKTFYNCSIIFCLQKIYSKLRIVRQKLCVSHMFPVLF